MHRRRVVCALAVLAGAGAPAAAAAEEPSAPAATPRHKIGAGTLHARLAERFPVQLGVPGLLELQLRAPRLLLLPARNLLGAGLQAQVGGSGLQGLPPGELDVAFALRYEPSDRSLRATRLEVLELRWPGLPPDASAALHQWLPLLAGQLGEFVLHRFTARELALPDAMGLQPQRLEVVQDGLVIHFAPARTP